MRRISKMISKDTRLNYLVIIDFPFSWWPESVKTMSVITSGRHRKKIKKIEFCNILKKKFSFIFLQLIVTFLLIQNIYGDKGNIWCQLIKWIYTHIFDDLALIIYNLIVYLCDHVLDFSISMKTWYSRQWTTMGFTSKYHCLS